RSMLESERENAGKQLLKIQNVVLVIQKIDINASSDYARLASLVYTDRFTYFISLTIGTIRIADTDYLSVALNSPVGLLISGKKKGDEFNLNGISYKITNVE